MLIKWRNNHRANLRQISERLEDNVNTSIDSMIELISNEHTPPAVKLQACNKIIEQWQNVRNLEAELNKRVFEETSLLSSLNADYESEL